MNVNIISVEEELVLNASINAITADLDKRYKSKSNYGVKNIPRLLTNTNKLSKLEKERLDLPMGHLNDEELIYAIGLCSGDVMSKHGNTLTLLPKVWIEALIARVSFLSNRCNEQFK